MSIFSCRICGKSRNPLRALCKSCTTLFDVVRRHLGAVGFSELLDVLLASGIDKQHVKVFLESNRHGRGSILDQITAALTNNLAEGIGVKEKGMSAEDVMRLRQQPQGVASRKPLDK